MSDENKPPLLRDIFRYNDAFSENETRLVASRYDYLLNRRDQFQDRVRNGTLILNSVSLLGVLTALGTDMIGAGKFGVTISDLAFAAAAFILGLILGVAGMYAENLRLPGEAARQYDRLARQMRQRAILNEVANERNVELHKGLMDEVHAMPQSDFEVSHWSLAFTNFSAGAWLAGVALPLFSIISLIEWRF